MNNCTITISAVHISQLYLWHDAQLGVRFPLSVTQMPWRTKGTSSGNLTSKNRLMTNIHRLTMVKKLRYVLSDLDRRHSKRIEDAIIRFSHGHSGSEHDASGAQYLILSNNKGTAIQTNGSFESTGARLLVRIEF